MPAPANPTEYLDLVRKSALIPSDKLTELIERHRASNTFPPTNDALAHLLVREGMLTFFQSKQIKLGRYKRFTIGTKYRLLELLGAGGMGAVYLCEHTLMKRLVALKVLPTEKLEDPSSLERFHREARAVAALNHPNIVRAHDIDQYDKLHFLVMEFVDGASLQEIVARHGPMNPARAAHYIAQAAVGIQHAHELGMVHRDIKPGNLLLDRTGFVKILDMGLARFFNKTSDNVTEKYDEKCVLGTADYLAPEQAISNNVDIRADIYSLGGTLYFLLTGQTPFPEGSISSKLISHQTRQPKPVSAYRKDVPASLLAVLDRMLVKSPSDRYQTPVEVAVALAEWGEIAMPAPPVKEMPALCPAVLALTGHSVEKPGQLVAPLSRVLFGPGSSAVVAQGSTARALQVQSGLGSSHAELAHAPRKDEDEVLVTGPMSTERASKLPTAPIPTRSKPSSGTRPPREVVPATISTYMDFKGPGLSSRMQWVLIGVAGLALFLAGALAIVLLKGL